MAYTRCFTVLKGLLGSALRQQPQPKYFMFIVLVTIKYLKYDILNRWHHSKWSVGACEFEEVNWYNVYTVYFGLVEEQPWLLKPNNSFHWLDIQMTVIRSFSAKTRYTQILISKITYDGILVTFCFHISIDKYIAYSQLETCTQVVSLEMVSYLFMNALKSYWFLNDAMFGSRYKLWFTWTLGHSKQLCCSLLFC